MARVSVCGSAFAGMDGLMPRTTPLTSHEIGEVRDGLLYAIENYVSARSSNSSPSLSDYMKRVDIARSELKSAINRLILALA